MSRALALLPAALALLITACITPTPADTVRYFEPPPSSVEPLPSPTGALRLNLGRVLAPAHLGRPMVWRRSQVELAFDERHRWAQEPAARVEADLQEALFLLGPWARHEGRAVARLEVQLESYEGVLGRRPEARVALVATLTSSEPQRTATRRFAAVAPLERSSPEALAHGIGEALVEVVSELRAWLGSELAP